MASCNVQTLLAAAKCFECLSPHEQTLVQLQLLCDLEAATTGGVGSVTCGVVDPTTAPVGTCALYYRTDTGSVWLWNGSAWNQIIA